MDTIENFGLCSVPADARQLLNIIYELSSTKTRRVFLTVPREKMRDSPFTDCHAIVHQETCASLIYMLTTRAVTLKILTKKRCLFILLQFQVIRFPDGFSYLSFFYLK